MIDVSARCITIICNCPIFMCTFKKNLSLLDRSLTYPPNISPLLFLSCRKIISSNQFILKISRENIPLASESSWIVFQTGLPQQTYDCLFSSFNQLCWVHKKSLLYKWFLFLHSSFLWDLSVFSFSHHDGEYFIIGIQELFRYVKFLKKE